MGPSSSGRPSARFTSRDRSGETLSHFILREKIGEGGMGVVYRAEDQKLRRSVALKLLPPGTMSEPTRRRFLREARMAAALSHTNIATVYEVGEEGEEVFLAMELIVGVSLRRLLGDGALPPLRALAIGLDVARGLGHAHARGIVHRDLKPENVLIGEGNVAKIVDFGIAASLLADEGPGAEIVSKEQLLVGTPQYMAPEQLRGEQPDPRSDIFSFALLLHEALAGKRAFPGRTVPEEVAAILHSEPTLLDAEEIPPDVVDLVARCLRKDPNGRPDAIEIVEILRRDLGALSTAPTQVVSTRSRLNRRRRRPWTILAIGAALAATLLALVLHSGARPGGTTTVADAAVSTATAAQSRAAAFVERTIGGGKAHKDWVMDVSPDGSRIVYSDGSEVATETLPAGTRTALPVPHEAARKIVGLSFTGADSIAYVVSNHEEHFTEVWTLGLHDAAPRRVRTDPLDVNFGLVSPDGRRVAYWTRAGDLRLGMVDGPPPESVMATGGRSNLGALSWSPASDALAYLLVDTGDTGAQLVWMSADGKQTNVISRDRALFSAVHSEGMAFAAADEILVLNYDKSDTALLRIPIGERGAIRGATQTLFAWHDATVGGLAARAGRIAFARGTDSGEVVRFGLRPDGQRLEGSLQTLITSAWPIFPLGFRDETHVALLEQKDDAFHVVLASDDGTVEPYVDGPIGIAMLVPNGDVLYWTVPDDAGKCSLMRHVASDRTERAAPNTGLSCNAEIVCVASRCIAQTRPDSTAFVFRDWSPESGATTPPFLRVETPDLRSAFSDDGRWLATSPHSGEITLHDMAHGGATKVLATKLHAVQMLDFFPDSRRLLVVGYDDYFTFTTIMIDENGAPHVLTSDAVRWSNYPYVAHDGRSFIVGRRNFGAYLSLLEPQ